MLYQDVRPSALSGVIGNTTLKEALAGQILLPPAKRAHTYLFHGGSGCGKTTLSRIMARELGSSGFDIVELDAAKRRDVDTMRQIVTEAGAPPMESDARVFIIDEAHELPRLAQETLLKTTEDTLSSTYFILCTTEPGKIIKTILNRCMSFQVVPLNDFEMERLIKRVEKKMKRLLVPRVRTHIVNEAGGSPRRALMLLEQVWTVKNRNRQMELIQKFRPEGGIWKICDVILQGGSWDTICGMYEGLDNKEPEAVRRAVLGYFRNIILKGGRLSLVGYTVISIMASHTYDSGEAGVLARMFEAVNEVKQMNSRRK